MKAPPSLSIGQVAREAGLRASAIRYYEQAGILPAPTRVAGRRRYDGAVLEVVDLIRLAQRAGFTIKEVRTLLYGFRHSTPASERWRRMAEQKIAELSARIAEAERMRDLLQLLNQCDCETLGECVRPQLVKLTRRR
ncbi:MAG TPA: MerR family transcriptional regulator [Gemmatimonadales bacterium]|jgi:MerR family redox-sensitive transcriptional activator SoxR|nr:MerR family transcriptional regulator [Gemmatimonadales bacterium]